MKATFQLESLGEISCILDEIMGWGNILKASKNWLERNIEVVVVTDGECILGLGDLGCETTFGGLRPFACLPVAIDVGTNNEKLLNDEFYIRLGQKRLLDEFRTAVKKNYGEKVLIQVMHNCSLLFVPEKKTACTNLMVI
ncbi:hypothetical protein Peur_040687 [Populus x canadensis]